MNKDILDVPTQDKQDFSNVEEINLNRKRVAVPFTLPSKGKLNGFDGKIKLLPMTTSHLLMLLTPALYRNDAVFVNIFRDCVIGLPFDVTDLLTQDKDAILIAIRAISYGNDYQFGVTCDSCEHEFETDINIERDIAVEYLESDKLKMPIHVPGDMLDEKKYVKLRYKTWRDHIAVGAVNEDKTDSLNTSVLDFLELIISEVESIGSNKMDIREWLNGISAKDASILLSIATSERFGVKKEFKTDPCPKCGSISHKTFHIDPSFFRPTVPTSFIDGLY